MARHTRDAMRNKKRENKRQTETDMGADRWVANGWREGNKYNRKAQRIKAVTEKQT